MSASQLKRDRVEVLGYMPVNAKPAMDPDVNTAAD